MPKTYTPLSSSTLSTAQPSVTFSSISGSYSDLVLVANAQSAQATTYDNLIIQFNSDTGSNYSRVRLNAFSGGVASEVGSNSNSFGIGPITGTSYSSTIFSQSTIQIKGYSNTTTYKTAIWRSNSQNDYVQAGVGTWRNTNAINSITIKTASGSNLAAGSTFSLYGVASAAVVSGAKATGGDTIATDGTYWYHAFRASGTFTPTQNLTADCLIIAGGGGGFGGGGGAGGLRAIAGNSLLNGTAYTVTVGAGGVGGGNNGSNSSISGLGFSTLTSTGGGGGGYISTGQSGGSGGGAKDHTNNARTGAAGNLGGYSPVEGYKGGDTPALTTHKGAGGGGAGGAGGNATSSGGGAGGAGTSTYSSWGSATGTGDNVSGTYWYASGGSGSSDSNNSVTRSPGGGGQGDRNPSNGNENAYINTGGGGGGGYFSIYGNGGSGLIIVRYPV